MLIAVLGLASGIALSKDEECMLSATPVRLGVGDPRGRLAMEVVASDGQRTLIDLPESTARGVRIPITCGKSPVRLGIRTPFSSAGILELGQVWVQARPERDADVSWEVPPLGNVRIAIEDGAGGPGHGLVSLSPQDQTAGGSGITLWPDASGAAEVVLPVGRYELKVDASPLSGDDVATWNGAPLPAGAPVTVQESDNQLLVTRKSASSVSGVVTDESGAPIANVAIEAKNERGEDVYTDVSRSDGEFVLAIDRFPVTLVARDPRGLHEFTPRQVVVDVESRSTRVHFEGRTSARFVEITLIEKETGAAVPAASLWAQAPGADQGSAVTSDENGIARVPCDGQSDLFVLVEQTAAGHLVEAEPTRVEAATCGAAMEIRVSRGAVIEGELVDENGDALAFEEFVLSRPSGGVWHLRTDAGGEFRQGGLRPGSYRLSWRGHPENRVGETSSRRAIRVIQVGGKAASSPAATVGVVHLESPNELQSVVAQLVGAARLCLDVRDRHARPLSVGHIDFHEPISRELVASHELATTRDVASSPSEATCGRHDLVPGEYLVRVWPVQSEFVPAWWPGVQDERIATPIDLRPGVNAPGRMVVSEAETIALPLAEALVDEGSTLRFGTSATDARGGPDLGDSYEPLTWLRARRVSPSEVEVDFVPRGLRTLHVESVSSGATRRLTFDLRSGEAGKTRALPRASTKADAKN
ncbi:MAG: carboxypeptidase regulatory-like domain-containing protein [Acidobacteria bacterium]|nr:carboxypeptidase regulatory-like domain-containing protein [Acidobacteriota bacterium]